MRSLGPVGDRRMSHGSNGVVFTKIISPTQTIYAELKHCVNAGGSSSGSVTAVRKPSCRALQLPLVLKAVLTINQ